MTHIPSPALVTEEDALLILGANTRGRTLAVRVLRPGSIGGTPVARITSMQVGFDWDSNLVLLTPEHPLTALSPEDVAAIHASAKEGQSWHGYQAHKKAAEEILTLKATIRTLTEERQLLMEPASFTWSDSAEPDTEVLRIGANLAGSIRKRPDGLYEADSTIFDATLAPSNQASAPLARASMETAARQWLFGLTGIVY